MKFMLQIIADDPAVDTVGPEESTGWDPLGAFSVELLEAGALVAAEGLQRPEYAVTVRFEEGSAPLVTDGPFADRDEQLAAFWIIDAPSVDAAVEWARKVPLPSGAVEVRPLVRS